MKTLLPYITAVVVTAFTMTSCETPGRSALAGAGAGAAIGGLLHGRGSDAMTGAAIGAGAGYLLGKIAQRDRYYDDEDAYYDEGYPIGRRTNRSGFVTSPYR